jgi:hypothetical protein
VARLPDAQMRGLGIVALILILIAALRLWLLG